MRTIALTLLVTLSFLQGFTQKINFRLYLIGDAGKETILTNGIRELLRENLDNKVPAAFAFLGDNIYPSGMPSVDDKNRPAAERIIQAQVELVKEFQAPAYFIPGNHDWNKGRSDGWNFIQNEQRYVDSLKNSFIHFFPKRGCPGPDVINLSNELMLIIIDSQWFLYPSEKRRGEKAHCACRTPEEVISALNQIIQTNSTKRIVIAAHHPLYSYGEHGGNFNWKTHLFPLRDVNSNLYVPLPIIGSLYPLYRKRLGARQDLANPVYRQYRKSLEMLLKQHPEIIFASGHEHALQHIVKDGVNYVGSGSGVNSSLNVRKKKFSSYASSKNGFSTIDIFEDKSVTISYFEVGRSGPAFTVHLPFARYR